MDKGEIQKKTMTHEEIYRTIAELSYQESAKSNIVHESADCPYYNADKTEGAKENEGTDKVI